MSLAIFLDISRYVPWYINMFLLPGWLFILYYIFIFGVAAASKAFLVLINMIHKPKEGVFKAEDGNPDFEYWRLRSELKKMAVWFMNNGPLPWTVMWAFRWFGVKMDFSSHLQDAWVDIENITFAKKITIGQGTVVMSSMIIGKYLIIKEIKLEDNVLIGGVSNIAPGIVIKNEATIGAFTNTIFNQIIEEGWVYFANPARKLKRSKYAEERKGTIVKVDVDAEKRFEVVQEINIDEDKRSITENNNKSKEEDVE